MMRDSPLSGSASSASRNRTKPLPSPLSPSKECSTMPVQLRGILAAVTTPFTADGSAVDEPVIKTQGDRLVAAGIHGLVPTGTTGDFMTLTPTEYRRVVELYVQAVAGRVPVVAGVGALSTKDAVELAR